MNILITGCRGQLGTEIQKQLKNGFSELGDIPQLFKECEITAIDIDTLDLSDHAEVMKYVGMVRPDIIVNCAAYTNVDGCEVNYDTAFKANAIGVRNLAMAAENVSAKLIHISTDYVFDGKENGRIPRDETGVPNPISAYGSTKYAGENFVKEFCSRYFIIRTAWLYSYYGKNFVKTIFNAAKKYGELEVVNDQFGNPTNAVDLAHEILQLAATEEYGLYHCTCKGTCSWYDFAVKIVQYSGLNASVKPCTSDEYKEKHPESALRPSWSSLDNRMLRCTIGDQTREWDDALKAFFANWDTENGMIGE